MEVNQDLNGVKLWQYMLDNYMHDGDKQIRIQRLEAIISTKYHPSYPEKIEKWVQSYDNAFAELVQLKESQWSKDSTKKNRIVANAKAMDIDHTLLQQMTKEKMYAQTCGIFRSHAIRKRYSNEPSPKTYKLHQTSTETATALLTRIEAPVWSQLPSDIKTLIIEYRKKEAKEKNSSDATSDNSGSQKTLPNQYTNVNLVQQSDIAMDGNESPNEN